MHNNELASLTLSRKLFKLTGWKDKRVRYGTKFLLNKMPVGSSIEDCGKTKKASVWDKGKEIVYEAPTLADAACNLLIDLAEREII